MFLHHPSLRRVMVKIEISGRSAVNRNKNAVAYCTGVLSIKERALQEGPAKVLRTKARSCVNRSKYTVAHHRHIRGRRKRCLLGDVSAALVASIMDGRRSKSPSDLRVFPSLCLSTKKRGSQGRYVEICKPM